MEKETLGMFDAPEQKNPGLDYPKRERLADIRHFLAVRIDRHATPQEIEDLDETIIRINTMTVDEALSLIAPMIDNGMGGSVEIPKRRDPKPTDEVPINPSVSTETEN